MTTFTITAGNSVRTTGFAEHAFNSDTAGADSLVVEAGAYLKAQGAFANGALLSNTKPWKVTVKGEIDSAQWDGLVLAAGNAGNSTINIDAGATVTGKYGAVVLQSAASLTNAGLISGELWGVELDGAGTHSIKNTNEGTIRGNSSAISAVGLSADTVENAGSIFGNVELGGGNDTLVNSAFIQGSVDLGAGNDALTNSNEIDGDIRAGEGNDAVVNRFGIIGGFVDLGDGNDTLTNTRDIYGAVDLGAGDDTMTNSGTVFDNVSLGAGNDKLTNSGTIEDFLDCGIGDDTVSNSGSIRGDLYLGSGRNSLTNKGGTIANVVGGSDSDTVVNTGAILTDVNLEDGNDSLTNSNLIDDDVFMGDGDDRVTNSGTISDLVSLGEGDNTLINKGVIGYSVIAGAGKDTITNSKVIANNVMLGDGENRLTNSGAISGAVHGGSGKDFVVNSGTIGDYVDLGGGDDVFTGGNATEWVWDGSGSDTVRLGGANDEYRATNVGALGSDGTDIIDGGAGIDLYNAGEASGGVFINLDSVAHDLSPVLPGAGFVAANTATGNDIAGAYTDKITGFENAIGGQGGIQGGLGTDTLFGFGGNDALYGGEDSDTLAGGTGKDILVGGIGGDTFLFTSVQDSGASATTRDTVADFEDGIDLINLYHIDANATNGTFNDAFTFIGTNVGFSNVAGQLRATWTTEGQLVEGDVNGDGKADFSIELTDPNHAITLTASDFVL
jgi:Ca2+-binding RTX toxin-like protein